MDFGLEVARDARMGSSGEQKSSSRLPGLSEVTKVGHPVDGHPVGGHPVVGHPGLDSRGFGPISSAKMRPRRGRSRASGNRPGNVEKLALM